MRNGRSRNIGTYLTEHFAILEPQNLEIENSVKFLNVLLTD